MFFMGQFGQEIRGAPLRYDTTWHNTARPRSSKGRRGVITSGSNDYWLNEASRATQPRSCSWVLSPSAMRM